MDQSQYEKVRQYLLDNGQQELVGHLDGLWQENSQLKSTDNPGDPEEPTDSPAEPKEPTSSDADAKPDPNETRASAQDFQDNAAKDDSAKADEKSNQEA